MEILVLLLLLVVSFVVSIICGGGSSDNTERSPRTLIELIEDADNASGGDSTTDIPLGSLTEQEQGVLLSATSRGWIEFSHGECKITDTRYAGHFQFNFR